MKLWLDDRREAPAGWVWAKTAAEAIALIDAGTFDEVSLDHDLGDSAHEPEWTGYTVLCHIESKVVWDADYVAPKIYTHSDNAPGIRKMRLGIESITRYMRAKLGNET